MKTSLFLASFAALFLTSAPAAEPAFAPDDRVLILGDSITQDGRWAALVEAYWWWKYPGSKAQFICAGLGSETACGLTERDHPFPRPNVHERLGRALAAAKPTAVVACYGMNDGIYHPFGDDRFAQYKGGIEKLVADCRAAGVKSVTLLTPPPFDAKSVRGRLGGEGEADYGYKVPFKDYDDSVLEKYGEWILTLPAAGGCDRAIDIHTPMEAAINARRAEDPDYKSGDGVHPNEEGQFKMGESVLLGLGEAPADVAAFLKALADNKALAGKIFARHRAHSTAWRVSIGHKRPGEQKAPPLPEATKAAAAQEAEVRAALISGK
ncbi:MAG: SGNH/GDSL hydrolase family protein [Verrucomicrobiales bacterium]